MIRYLKHSEIDMEEWDACINASPNGLVYAYSWYLNIVAGEWYAFVEDDYSAVFPVFPKRKFGLSYSLQPLWAQQLGLFSTKLFTPEKSAEFLHLIVKKFRWIDMNLNSYQKLPVTHNFKIQENNNFLLSLLTDYEQIKKGYSDNVQRNLKRNSATLNVTTSADHEEIIRLFRQNRGKDIRLLDDGAYKMFSRLIYHARSISVAKIFGVYDETNSLLGGAVFLVVKDRVVMIFSALGEEGRNRSAMHVLIDAFIREHSGKNLILDFEGSNDENLARFYRSFGSVNSPYLRITSNRLFLPTKCINILKKLL